MDGQWMKKGRGQTADHRARQTDRNLLHAQPAMGGHGSQRAGGLHSKESFVALRLNFSPEL
eukprot:scaffold85141_cov42-Phaeocystis_antarctica.AAC.4